MFKKLFKNINYLNRYSLKKMNFDIEMLYKTINHLKYEIADEKNIIIPQILNLEETMQTILTEPKSIIRFGDGEFELTLGRSARFQKTDKNLQEN